MNTVPDETRKRPIAVADYHRMGEAGVFGDDERVELIEGEIYAMPPIGQRHTSIVDRLNERFVLACSGQAIVRVQNPLTLGELSEPQPDISLLHRREDFYAGVPQNTADVLLVVEVADSSSVTGDRHRSLAAAIDWSAQLLSESARDLHESIGSMRGGFAARDLAEFLVDLRPYRSGVRPVETHPGRAALRLVGSRQGGQAFRDAVEGRHHLCPVVHGVGVELRVPRGLCEQLRARSR